MRILPGSEPAWLRLAERLLDSPRGEAVSESDLMLMRATLRLLVRVVLEDRERMERERAAREVLS